MLFILTAAYCLSTAMAQVETFVAPSTFVASSTIGAHIFQMITPTTQASQVPLTALERFSTDAFNFYAYYTSLDKFTFGDQLIAAQETLSYSAQTSIAAEETSLIQLVYEAYTSLIDEPSSYLSRLHDSASPWPSHLSSSLLSQATGILLGYESLASKDVLSKKPAHGPITPGMSIDIGAKATGAASTGAAPSSAAASSTTATQGAAATTAAAAQKTVTSKAAAAPVATANAQLLMSAAAAAAGVIGAVLL